MQIMRTKKTAIIPVTIGTGSLKSSTGDFYLLYEAVFRAPSVVAYGILSTIFNRTGGNCSTKFSAILSLKFYSAAVYCSGYRSDPGGNFSILPGIL